MNESSTDRMRGTVAVVTGSSRGIGRWMALELARCGADILVHGGHDERPALAVVDEIRSLGRRADAAICDLADTGAQRQLVQKAWQWSDRIDVWINNAGADVLTGAARNWDFDTKLAALWQVDVVATATLSRAAGARMKQRGSGTIINMGWDQAERGMEGDSGELFALVKGAVMAFSKSLSVSLAPEVRVNCLAPGWIRTAWGETASREWQRRARRESQLARWGTPEDVARVARFLASPGASYLTGQTVAINGGFRPGEPARA